MNSKPILFNGDMVRAIRAGRKTQTRRPFKLPAWAEWATDGEKTGNIDPKYPRARGWYHIEELACPYGTSGDRLWVRETWQGPLIREDEANEYWQGQGEFKEPKYCVYAADGGTAPEFMDADDNIVRRWRPPIHMPSWASRITLEIIESHVERLQECDEASAIAEGVVPWRCGDETRYMLGDGDGIGVFGKPGAWRPEKSAVEAYRKLWDSINASCDYSWESNPWVWVITFRDVSAEKTQC